MREEKGKIIPLLVLPVIWGSYYVASQQLVGYTSAFTSGLGIRFLTLIFLTVIMWRRKELRTVTRDKGSERQAVSDRKRWDFCWI